MVDDYNNATPEQIKRAQEYAYGLLNPQDRIQHWTGGAAHILNALVGRQILNQSTQSDYAQRQAMGQNRANLLSSMTPPSELDRVLSQNQQNPQLPSVRTGSLPDTPQPTDIAATGNPIEQPKVRAKLDDYVKRLFEVESNNNPSAVKGSYRGLGQFSKDLERKYGINDQNWKDPTVQINAASQHAVNNAQEFKNKFGYEPSNGQLYLMHQQGTTGGMNLMGQNPNAPAWETIKEAANVSDNVAKQRIMQNLPAGSELAKKPVDQVTNDEYTKLWTNRFENGVNKYPDKMGLGGPKPEDITQPNAPQGQQLVQASGIPPAVSDPSANINKDALAKFMADPRVPEEHKASIQDMMIKGATPQSRETAAGPQQFRPSQPGEISMPGAASQGSIHVHGITVPMVNTRMPDGSMRSQFLLPGGKLTDLEGVTDWGRQQGRKDTRATEMAGSYAKKEIGIQNASEGASKNKMMLNIADRLSDDPAFYSGTGANKVLDYTKIASYVTGNPNWSGSTEAFAKVMAGANIAGLEAFKNLGQIRNSEIELLRESQGNIPNTHGAIKAVIKMNHRASTRLEEIGQKMRDYRDKHGQVDEGFDKELAEFYKEKPLFSENEMKDYRRTLFGEKNTSPDNFTPYWNKKKDNEGYTLYPKGRIKQLE